MSIAPVAEWSGRRVRVRLSRSGDAVTVRLDGEARRLVRVAPFPADVQAMAGPLVCAPTRAGLQVRFCEWSLGPADPTLP